DPGEQLGIHAAQGVLTTALAQLGNVGARSKDSPGTAGIFWVWGCGAGDNEGSRVGLEPLAEGVEFIDHGLVDGVEYFGAIHGGDDAVRLGIVHANVQGFESLGEAGE